MFPLLSLKCVADHLLSVNLDDWIVGPNPNSKLHAGLFLSHVKRCFIRSLMPLQLTDGAIQDDRLLQSVGPYHPSDVLYDPSPFVIISKPKKKKEKKKSHFSEIQRITEEAILGLPLYSVDKVGGNCANCLLLSFILQ